MKPLRIATVLAVAALVAVAAVVLRPILQRAKQQSLVETCIERAANLGDALLAYAEINNGRLPLAFAYDSNKRNYRWQQVIPYPANWNFTSDLQRIQEDLCTWANSTLALSRNDKNFFCPATEIIHMPGVEYRIKRPLPAAMTYTFNGLLHAYAVSAVESGEQTILGWEGIGAVTLNGYAIANPTLECVAGIECRFLKAPARFLMPIEQVRTFKNSCVAVMADGHAAIIGVQSVFGQIDVGGKPTSWLGSDDYPLLFRPAAGKKKEESTRFYKILRPDTERPLTKRS